MLQKINILIYCVVLYIVKKKFLNIFIQKLSFKFILSNHPRRLELYTNQIKDISFWFDNKLSNNFKKNFYYLRNKKIEFDKNKEIIFVGDSHVEFLSRIISKENSIYPYNRRAFWVGPKTLMGIISKNNIIDLNTNLNFIVNSNNKKKYVIFSFGSIDVRTAIYELKLRKIIQNNYEIIKIFKNTLNIFFENIISNCIKKNSVIGVGFLELINSPSKGKNPKTLNKLLFERKYNNFPTFGDFKERKNWTRIINNVLKKITLNYKVDLIKTESIINKTKKKEIFDEDMIHINSQEIMCKINTNIVNKLKHKK
jgi:hypothetical protein